MYVCIFKYSFLKWTVGEEITNRLFTAEMEPGLRQWSNYVGA